MRSMRDVVSMKGNGRRQGEEASTPREQLAECVCGRMEGTCPAIDTRIDKVEGAVLSKTHLQKKEKILIALSFSGSGHGQGHPGPLRKC